MDAAASWFQTMVEAEGFLRSAELARDGDAAIAAATRAVTAFRAALDLAPVERTPLDWAETQSRLSVALRLLGALLDDVELLHDAIRSAQAALSVAPLATAPQIWGRARAALGSVYVVLGERDGDLATLAEAAASYAEATEGFPRAAFPQDWARMMRNRGAALSLLGEVANDPDALIDAIGCYRAALEVYALSATAAGPVTSPGTAPMAPLGAAPALSDWALTHSNLGQALRLLGERIEDTQSSAQHLREAVAACEVALTATPQDAAPEEWAMTATNLANALAALGERVGDPDCLHRAIDVYRQALAALGGPRWLRQRAIARHNLALAEQRLAARTGANG
jgi:tetratricopeptide (TPR) repeat protein